MKIERTATSTHPYYQTVPARRAYTLGQPTPGQHNTRRYRYPSSPLQPRSTFQTSARQAFRRKDQTELDLSSIDAIRRIDLFHQGHVVGERDVDTLHVPCQHLISTLSRHLTASSSLTLNSAAPCFAASTTCNVALSPTFTVIFAGSGT